MCRECYAKQIMCGKFICCICSEECEYRGDGYNFDIPPVPEGLWDCLGAK